MGEQTSEQLHIEVKASVLQYVRLKYACRHCERHAIHTPVVTAPMPAQPLPGGNASPALIATVMTGKYADGTPLYRMEQALARANITVGRGTLAHWVIAPAERHLSRLVAVLRATLLSQPLIHGDETTMQVLKEDGKSAQSQSYAWGYRSAADSDCPVVLFDYQPGRGQRHPQAFLACWHGTLMSDGYSAWRTIEGVTHLGCAARYPECCFILSEAAWQQRSCGRSGIRTPHKTNYAFFPYSNYPARFRGELTRTAISSRRMERE
jgi:transposase